jgi:hypothetical protein
MVFIKGSKTHFFESLAGIETCRQQKSDNYLVRKGVYKTFLVFFFLVISFQEVRLHVALRRLYQSKESNIFFPTSQNKTKSKESQDLVDWPLEHNKTTSQ